MALRQLLNTEKRLLKNSEIGETYTNNINQYLEKGYIRRLDPTEKSPPKKWYLPHFPVVRLDRTTTKTLIVLDASPKFEAVSLNDAIYQGPKLQRELTDVLLRFRTNPFALLCDIAEMQLRSPLKTDHISVSCGEHWIKREHLTSRSSIELFSELTLHRFMPNLLLRPMQKKTKTSSQWPRRQC